MTHLSSPTLTGEIRLDKPIGKSIYPARVVTQYATEDARDAAFHAAFVEDAKAKKHADARPPAPFRCPTFYDKGHDIRSCGFCRGRERVWNGSEWVRPPIGPPDPCDCGRVESGRHDRECPASGESVAKGLRPAIKTVADIMDLGTLAKWCDNEVNIHDGKGVYAARHRAIAAALRLMIHEEQFVTYSLNSPVSEARVLLRKNLGDLLTQAFTEDKR